MGKDQTGSPEQLKSYIKVANAGIWAAVIAIIVLLAGVCVWGVFGRLETTVNAVAVCDGGKVTAYVSADDSLSVTEGMSLNVNGQNCEIVSVSAEYITAQDSSLSEYALYLGGFSGTDKICEVVAYGSVDSGIYAAQIVVESLSPISFLFS